MSADPVIGEAAVIRPEPTDEEVAAIVAALYAIGSGGAGGGSQRADAPDAAPRWRWSGRWWTKPEALNRQRPW